MGADVLTSTPWSEVGPNQLRPFARLVPCRAKFITRRGSLLPLPLQAPQPRGPRGNPHMCPHTFQSHALGTPCPFSLPLVPTSDAVASTVQPRPRGDCPRVQCSRCLLSGHHKYRDTPVGCPRVTSPPHVPAITPSALLPHGQQDLTLTLYYLPLPQEVVGQEPRVLRVGHNRADGLSPVGVSDCSKGKATVCRW